MKTIPELDSVGYITEALLYLMETEPYESISVTDVCRKAGVSRMTFYRHFEGKLDVLRKMTARITDRFIKESQISYKGTPLPDYLVTLFEHLYRHREKALLLDRAGLLHIIKDDMDRVFLESYGAEYEAYKSCFIAGGLFNAFEHWLKGGFRETPREVAGKLADMLEQ